MKIIKLTNTLGIILVALLIASCSGSSKISNSNSETIIITNPNGLGYTFAMEFTKGKYHHYPLIAVWIEDYQGNYLQTIYVSKSVGKGTFDHADASLGKWQAGPLQRPATLPYWAHKNFSTNKRPEVFPSQEYPIADAYTGATPKGNFELKSKTDKKIEKPFRIMMEINQFFDFNKFWHNDKFADNKDYKTSGQPALVYSSEIIYPQNLPAEIELKAIGHSHYSGENGMLYTSLNTITTALKIVEKVKVKIVSNN